MKEISAVPNVTTDLSEHRLLRRRINHTDRSHIFAGKGTHLEISPNRPFRVAVVPLVFELYDRIMPDLRARLQQFFNKVAAELQIPSMEILPCELVSNLSHMKRICEDFSSQAVDMIVVAHLSYVPSGQILAALLETDTPILLWPAQPMERVITEELDAMDISMNHSVHGTMDLANMLRRAKRPYGVVHGHWEEPAFQRDLIEWAQVGAMLRALRSVNPLVLGERFPDMLDLRLEKEPFMKALGINPYRVPLSEFVEVRHTINESAVLEVFEGYQDRFEIAPSLDEPLLLRSAKNELVLRHLLEKHQSRAVAVNFLDVCVEPEIADALHLPASNLMAEGIGYAAEADWETASMISAMQTVCGNSRVGFTEVFSVDYAENRILLRHWGEGNPAQAAGKPRLVKSVLNHISTYIAFPICDFQYRAGRYSLLNLSVTPEGQGQLVMIPGEIDDALLPNCDGVKSLFKADCTDVRELLNRYATQGASHHLLLIEGDATQFVGKIAQLAGWTRHTIK